MRSPPVMVLCLGIALLLVSSCETISEHWAVPTEYEIRDVGADSDAVKEIKEALQKDGDPYGFVEDTSGRYVGDGPDVAYRFRLENVNTVNDLNSVQAIIREITVRYNVPVDFASALLTFKSLEGSALTQIIVTGTATRGSIVYLDDGTSELVRVPNVDDDGSWSMAIVTNPALQVRGGWVYGAVEKEDTRLFFRTLIWDPSDSETIAAADLPPGSPLRQLGEQDVDE